MFRWYAIASCVVCAASWAVESRDLTGVYEGELRGGVHLEAHAVALSDKSSGKFFVRFFFDGETSSNVVVNGSRDGDRVNFSGTVELTADRGGSCDVEAAIHNGSFEGRFSGDKAPGSFRLERVVRQSPTLGQSPPPEAIVLYDGTSLDAWRRHPETWVESPEGGFEVAPSDLITRQVFGDIDLHIEFQCPFMPNDRGQARGNSGVYIQGRYEVQVLDSFGLISGKNDCASIYNVAAPRVNACSPPGEWQTYDIRFRAARFDSNGQKIDNARITLRHNGVLVHDDLELKERSGGGMSGKEIARGPLLLQDHRNRVRYRNIWAVPRS